MSDSPLGAAEALLVLLAERRPLTDVERAQALRAAEALVEYTERQTRGLRRRKLAPDELEASRGAVAGLLAEFRAHNPQGSNRSACRWIAKRADLPAGRVKQHLRELREQSGKHARVSHSPHGAITS